MKRLLTALLLSLVATTMSSAEKMTCTLTGKEVKTCCCEMQKDGKMICKLTGKTLDKCCCKGM
jgi:hypothetical protein